MQTPTQTSSPRRDRAVGGIVLIALGIIFLFGQTFNVGWLVLPVLGAAFLVAGIVTRKSGWFVPAGVLGGLSLGIPLTDGTFHVATGDAQGGLFLLAFAAGWACIPLLSRLFTRDTHLWALIPAAILALIGGAVLGGGVFVDALQYLSYAWPLALIATGLYILLRRRAARE